MTNEELINLKELLVKAKGQLNVTDEEVQRDNEKFKKKGKSQERYVILEHFFS